MPGFPPAGQSPERREQVDHPRHYGGADNPYEVIKVLEAWLSREEFIGAMKFNIIKYHARAAHKANAEEDMRKAAWYDNYLKEYLTRHEKLIGSETQGAK